jgi:hypothetical protein
MLARSLKVDSSRAGSKSSSPRLTAAYSDAHRLKLTPPESGIESLLGALESYEDPIGTPPTPMWARDSCGGFTRQSKGAVHVGMLGGRSVDGCIGEALSIKKRGGWHTP